MREPLNLDIAARFDEVAQLLVEQGASRYRIEAYRRGAEMLRQLTRPVSDVLRDEGVAGLERLPAIGETLARAIRAIVETGRLPMLDRLRGETDAVRLLSSVPGIGAVLAGRLHRDLGIDTLEDLEVAAYDGRLAAMALIGEKRLAGIRDALTRRLGRVRVPAAHPDEVTDPPLADLLMVDGEYRTRAAEGSLRTIAPRRFNPKHESWLPILHTQRAGRDYTALFSNTQRAHELGRTRDWVVLYVDGGRGERRYTIVTAPRGVLKGRRIVRGREVECLEYYRHHGLHLPAQAPDHIEV